MGPNRLAFGLGLALLVGAVFVFDGVDPSGMRFDMPNYLRIPAATILVGSGIYSVYWSFRRLWRNRDVPALVIMLGILGYLGIAALSSMMS